MEERRVRGIAVAMVLIGFSVLGWYAFHSRDGTPIQEIREIKVQDIKVQDLKEPDAGLLVGSRISITGSVVRVEDHGKVHFLKLSPAAKFPLVSFDPVDVQRNEKVKVTGKVKMYKGSPELIVERIARVD